jgi:hypothetical protein
MLIKKNCMYKDRGDQTETKQPNMTKNLNHKKNHVIDNKIRYLLFNYHVYYIKCYL